MLVAHAHTRDHHDVLVVGLSAANRSRLELGETIDLHLAEASGPLKIVIFAGDTEDTMQTDLFSLFDAGTRVTKLEVP